MSAYKTYNDFEFHSQNEENMEILVGTNDLNSLGGARYKVKKAIKHEFFYLSEYSQSDYDIALLWLQNHIEFTDTVKPIKYSTEEVGENEMLQTSGWGYYKWDYERVNKHIYSISILREKFLMKMKIIIFVKICY